jgi:hypothetical protein
MATKVWVGGGDGSNATTYTDWHTAGNWSASGVPAAGDDVIVPADADYGIAGTTSAVSLNTFEVEIGYAHTVGSASVPLMIDYDTHASQVMTIGGIEQQFYDVDNAARIEVREAAVSPADGQYGLHFGAGLDNAEIHVKPADASHSISIAARAGESFEVDDVYIGNGSVAIGSGVVDTSAGICDLLEVSGGEVTCEAEVTAIKHYGQGGLLHYRGLSTNATGITAFAGQTWLDGAGTFSLETGGNATVDASMSSEAKTCSGATAYSGYNIIDPGRSITWSAGIDLVGCGRGSGSVDLGRDYTETPSEI